MMSSLYKSLLPYLLLFLSIRAKQIFEGEHAGDIASLSDAYEKYLEKQFYSYKERIQLANDILLYYSYSEICSDSTKKFSLLASNFSLARIYMRNIAVSAISFIILRPALFMLSMRRKIKAATTPAVFPERRARKAARKSASTAKKLEKEIEKTKTGKELASKILTEELKIDANSSIEDTIVFHFRQPTTKWLPAYLAEAIKILEQQYEFADNETDGKRTFLLLRYLKLIQEQQRLTNFASDYNKMTDSLVGKVCSIVPGTKTNSARRGLLRTVEKTRADALKTGDLLKLSKADRARLLFFNVSPQPEPVYEKLVKDHCHVARDLWPVNRGL